MDPALIMLGRWGFGLLFAVALGHKLRDWPEFITIVGEYRLLPAGFAAPATAAIIGAEAALIVLLAMAPPPVAFAAVALLLLGYAAAMAINLGRGRRHISCGCGGRDTGRALAWGLVIRNIGLAAIAAALAVPAQTARGLDGYDAATIIAALVSLALAYMALDAMATVPLRRATR